MWNRSVRILGTLAILLALIASLTPAVLFAGRALVVEADIEPCDAIIVLGAGMLADETLSNQSMRRLMHGLVLFKSGLAPWLIVSGPRQGSDRSEAAVRSDIAVRLGVPAAAILQMENVNTTRDEAFTAAGLLSGRNLNRVLLVTEPLHMRRSKGVFEAAGMKVFPAPSDNFAAAGLGPVERLLLLKDLAVQSAGLLYYRLAGFI